MHRNIMAAAHTDSADFTGTRRISVQPYAGGFLHTPGGYPVGSAYADYGFFQQMHIFFQAQRELLQVQDRIAHKLPRPVISDRRRPGLCDRAKRLWHATALRPAAYWFPYRCVPMYIHADVRRVRYGSHTPLLPAWHAQAHRNTPSACPTPRA